ncbi:MAG: hypothetical protein AAFY20_03790 [Cyanobacteria bacterium J06639_14]
MFSLQPDRFRAILLGILIADALSHQCWHGETPSVRGQPATSAAIPAPLPMAIKDPHWCQHVTQSLSHQVNEWRNYETDIKYQFEQNADKQWDSCDEVTAILATIPLFLQGIAHLEPASLMELLQRATVKQPLVAMFYSTAMALLDTHRVATSGARFAKTPRMPIAQGSASPIITLAYEYVFAANGDFSLAVGQGLQAASQMAGLPILTGFLSTCWVGPQGLPTRWYQALLTPTPTLQHWLQRRWQIDSVDSLHEWGKMLESLWLGQYSSALNQGQRTIYPAIQAIL